MSYLLAVVVVVLLAVGAAGGLVVRVALAAGL
jgi:hypothetical protein